MRALFVLAALSPLIVFVLAAAGLKDGLIFIGIIVAGVAVLVFMAAMLWMACAYEPKGDSTTPTKGPTP